MMTPCRSEDLAVHHSASHPDQGAGERGEGTHPQPLLTRNNVIEQDAVSVFVPAKRGCQSASGSARKSPWGQKTVKGPSRSSLTSSTREHHEVVSVLATAMSTMIVFSRCGSSIAACDCIHTGYPLEAEYGNDDFASLT